MKILTISLLVCSFILSPSCKESSKPISAKDEKRFEEYGRKMEELSKQQRESFEKNGYIDDDALDEQTNQAIAASRELEASSEGDAKKIAKVMRLFMENIQSDMKKLDAHMPELEKAATIATVSDIADLDKRIEVTKKYLKVNDMLISKAKGGWYRGIRSDLNKVGATDKQIKEFMQGVKIGMDKQMPLIVKIRNTDTVICNSLLIQFKTLKSEHGKWKYDAEKNEVKFENAEATKTYAAANEAIEKAAQEQHLAQKELYTGK